MKPGIGINECKVAHIERKEDKNGTPYLELGLSAAEQQDFFAKINNYQSEISDLTTIRIFKPNMTAYGEDKPRKGEQIMSDITSVRDQFLQILSCYGYDPFKNPIDITEGTGLHEESDPFKAIQKSESIVIKIWDNLCKKLQELGEEHVNDDVIRLILKRKSQNKNEPVLPKTWKKRVIAEPASIPKEQSEISFTATEKNNNLHTDEEIADDVSDNESDQMDQFL